MQVSSKSYHLSARALHATYQDGNGRINCVLREQICTYQLARVIVGNVYGYCIFSVVVNR